MSQHTSLTTATTTLHQPASKGARLIMMIFKNRILATFALVALTTGLFSSQPVLAVSDCQTVKGNESLVDNGNGETVTVRFKGTIQGNDLVSPGPSPTTFVITTTGTGMGTLQGQFSFTQEVTVNGVNLTDTGSAHWIAANGDSIYTTVAGSAIPGDVVFTITEIHTITGGTGRFEGAQGSFTMHRTHVVAPSDNGTHVTSGWFEGTITSPGATH